MAEPLNIAVEVVGVDDAAADLARMEAAEEGVARAANTELAPAIARVERELAESTAAAGRLMNANAALGRSFTGITQLSDASLRAISGTRRSLEQLARVSPEVGTAAAAAFGRIVAAGELADGELQQVAAEFGTLAERASLTATELQRLAATEGAFAEEAAADLKRVEIAATEAFQSLELSAEGVVRMQRETAGAAEMAANDLLFTADAAVRGVGRQSSAVARASRDQRRNFAGVTRATQAQGREFGTLVNIAGELGFTVGAVVPQFRTLGTQLAVVGGSAFQLGAIFGPLGVAFGVISGFLPQLVQGFADTAEELDNTTTAADRASLAMSKLERRARTAGERIRSAISLAQGIENDEALLARVSTGDGSLQEQRGFLNEQRARQEANRANILNLLDTNELEQGREREILLRDLLRGEFGGSLDLQGSAETQARAFAAQAATINAAVTEAEGFVERVEEIDRQNRAIQADIDAAEATQIARDEAEAARNRSGRQTREQRLLAEKLAQLNAEASEVEKLDRLERARFDASTASELELRMLRDEKLEQMEAEASNLEKLRTEEERLIEQQGRKLAVASQLAKAQERETEAAKERARAESEQARVDEANLVARIKLNEKTAATEDVINGVGSAIVGAAQLAAQGEMALGAALQQQFDLFLANTATQQTIEGFVDLARAASATFIPNQGPAAAKAFAIGAGLHFAAAGLAGGASAAIPNAGGGGAGSSGGAAGGGLEPTPAFSGSSSEPATVVVNLNAPISDKNLGRDIASSQRAAKRAFGRSQSARGRR